MTKRYSDQVRNKKYQYIAVDNDYYVEVLHLVPAGLSSKIFVMSYVYYPELSPEPKNLKIFEDDNFREAMEYARSLTSRPFQKMKNPGLPPREIEMYIRYGLKHNIVSGGKFESPDQRRVFDICPASRKKGHNLDWSCTICDRTGFVPRT